MIDGIEEFFHHDGSVPACKSVPLVEVGRRMSASDPPIPGCGFTKSARLPREQLVKVIVGGGDEEVDWMCTVASRFVENLPILAQHRCACCWLGRRFGDLQIDGDDEEDGEEDDNPKSEGPAAPWSDQGIAQTHAAGSPWWPRRCRLSVILASRYPESLSDENSPDHVSQHLFCQPNLPVPQSLHIR